MGALVTVPVPVPALLTVSVGGAWTPVNVALTLWLALSVNVQVGLLPLQAPPQLVKLSFAAGVAVSVICVPLLKLAVQVWTAVNTSRIAGNGSTAGARNRQLKCTAGEAGTAAATSASIENNQAERAKNEG